jgi:hypothetical protein
MLHQGLWLRSVLVQRWVVMQRAPARSFLGNNSLSGTLPEAIGKMRLMGM